MSTAQATTAGRRRFRRRPGRVRQFFRAVFSAGVVVRIFAAMLLVFGTWNPSGYSYTQMIAEQIGDPTIFEYGRWKLFCGAVMLALWAFFVVITIKSLNWWIVLVGGVIGLGLWSGINWLQGEGYSLTGAVIGWLIETAIAVVLGIGMAWGRFYRRMTGLLPVDHVESEHVVVDHGEH